MTFTHPAEEGMDFSNMKKILQETIEQDAAVAESKIRGAIKFLSTLKSGTMVKLEFKDETIEESAKEAIAHLHTMEDTDDPSDFIVSLVEQA